MFLSDQIKEIDPTAFVDQMGDVLIHCLIIINVLVTPAPNHVQHHHKHRSMPFDCDGRQGDSNPAKLNWHEFNDQSDKINILTCQLEIAKEKWTALSDLTNILRMRLITLIRAERHQRKAKKRAQKQNALIGNSFCFPKKILGMKQGDYLACVCVSVLGS